MTTDITVHLDGDPPIRKEGFFEAKTFELTVRIATLEYDNAELSRWANDICLPKLSELSDELAMRYNQKKHRNRNWKNELPRV
mgnify:CR=1 FL=1